MTTDEALARLRSDWSLGRGDNYLTDEPGWAVCLLMNGKQSQRLGWAKTVVEAIEAAEVKAAQNEIEEAERRKADGQLTPVEKASSFVHTIWASKLDSYKETNSLTSQIVNQSFESGMNAGDVVRMDR